MGSPLGLCSIFCNRATRVENWCRGPGRPPDTEAGEHLFHFGIMSANEQLMIRIIFRKCSCRVISDHGKQFSFSKATFLGTRRMEPRPPWTSYSFHHSLAKAPKRRTGRFTRTASQDARAFARCRWLVIWMELGDKWSEEEKKKIALINNAARARARQPSSKALRLLPPHASYRTQGSHVDACSHDTCRSHPHRASRTKILQRQWHSCWN